MTKPQAIEEFTPSKYNRDAAKKNFREAFGRAKAAFKPVLKASPSHYGKYANLADTLNAVEEALLKEGFTVHQPLQFNGMGNMLETKLCHVDGHEETSQMILHSKDDQDPQKVGSAITYYRRYALSSMLGIATEDDDGVQASEAKTPERAGEYKMGIPKNKNLGKTLDEMGINNVQNDYNYWATRVKSEGRAPTGQVKFFLENAKAWLDSYQAGKGHKDFSEPDTSDIPF